MEMELWRWIQWGFDVLVVAWVLTHMRGHRK